MSDLTRIVKAYDVRGIVPDELNEDVARAVGAAFVQTLRAGGEAVDTIVVAYDMRESSPVLATGSPSMVTPTAASWWTATGTRSRPARSRLWWRLASSPATRAGRSSTT